MKREVVKSRTTRQVLRVVTEEGDDLHEKRVILRAHLGRRLAVLLGRNAVRSEARHLERLRAMGVLAPEVVSRATLWSRGLPGELVLVTRTLAGFAPLPRGAEDDPAVATALGRYVRQLHDRGVFHDDFHRGNLLADADGRFALLDADRVRFVGRPSPDERRRGLRRVLLGFRGLARGERLEHFLRAYGGAEFGFRGPELEREVDDDLLRHVRERSYRALRENPDFARLLVGRLRWHVRRGIVPPLDPEASIGGERRLKAGRSSTVIDRGEAGVLKIFHPWRLRGRLSARLRGDRARRAFRKGHLLELLGVPTPKVLACAADRASARSYLLCERVLPGEPASTLLAESPPPALRRSFLASIGEVVGRLHAAGFSHRDLKGRNLLHGGEGRAVVLDLDSLDDVGTVPPGRRVADLARLVASGRMVPGTTLRDLVRVLRAYQRVAGGDLRDLLVQGLSACRATRPGEGAVSPSASSAENGRRADAANGARP